MGHGVGAGILSVPYLASHNSIREILLIIGFCYLFNVLHLLIAELSYSNQGAQFVSCFEAELFGGKLRKILTWLAFACKYSVDHQDIRRLSTSFRGGHSLLVRSAGHSGYADILCPWRGRCFSLGMKLVGICEKLAVSSMIAVT